MTAASWQNPLTGQTVTLDDRRSGRLLDHKAFALTKDATVTDQGEFTAIAAAYTVDRHNDQIIPGAFAKTIDAWRATGKRIPLHWNHLGDAQYIIGSVDPATMREVNGEGLQVSGRLDLADSEVAREAWRAMKTGSMSLSFGYQVPTGQSTKRGDGVTELREIDLFEVSIVPAPANGDTRVLSMKSAIDAPEQHPNGLPAAWQHPGTGQLVTFNDNRSSAARNDPEPALEETPEFKAFMEEFAATLATTPAHEGRHAAVVLLFGFKAMQARADIPEEAKMVLGRVSMDLSGEVWTRLRLAEYMVGILAGPVGEKTGAPKWPLRSSDGYYSDEDALARLADQLQLNRKQYEGLVDVAAKVLEDPCIQRAADYIATMLSAGLVLDERMLADLYKQGVESVQKEHAAPTAAELEHAAAVEEHRQSMVTYLGACDEYRKDEDAKALRRECERISREFGIELA